MTLSSAVKKVLVYEGGYTNDPDDPGGATNKGIIQTEYDKYRRGKGLQSRSVRLIEDDETRQIYESNYWAPTHAQWLPDPLAYVMFDTAVLMGVGTAKKLLNTALAVGWQGSNWTPLTSSRLWKSHPVDLARRICDLRENRLRGLVDANQKLSKFLKGWLNRLDDIRKYVDEVAAG